MAKKKMTLEEKLEDAIVKDVPYEVPENWVWCKLGSYIDYATDYVANGSFASLKENVQVYKDENYALMVKTKDFGNNFEKDLTYTDEKGYEFLAKSKLFGGELILSNVGSIGKIFRVPYIDKPMTLASNSIMIKCHNELDYDYLYYLLLSPIGYDLLMSITTGTAVMKFNKTGLKSLPIPIPPIKEQQRIVDRIESLFEKLDKAKELIEEARDDFEKRKTAILERAFRGELTKEWRRKNNIIRSEERSKLGDIVKINPKRDKLTDIDDNKECTFVPMPSVSEITGVVEKPLVEKYSKVKKGYTYFKENDVIFAKITPCMENGKSAIVTNLIDGFGFGSTEFHVIRCNENVLNRFVYHLVRSKFFRDSASQHMTGAVGQRRVPKNFLEEYEIILPILQEQKEIVRILDKLLEEESKIEELTKLQEQIELIKKSILAKAFRGQLGTNSEDDEGAIELLKEILNK